MNAAVYDYYFRTFKKSVDECKSYQHSFVVKKKIEEDIPNFSKTWLKIGYMVFGTGGKMP